MKALAEAQKDLDTFLEEYPHMQEQQNKIDEIMKKTPSDKRLEVLLMMLAQKYSKILKQLKKLKQIKSY